MRRIIVICGPTAVGKTEYSIRIAKRIDGEIVSADSMQLYKFMNIGSAKPTAEELTQVPHHLVDAIDPREPFSVAMYQSMAKSAIQDIFNRGKTPVISGGTGLYINSLIYEMDFSAPPGDLAYRKELEFLAEEKGREAVYRILKYESPDTAERIHPNNLKKVIRALEVIKESGKSIKPFEESFIPVKEYRVSLIGLSRTREELYNRINARVDEFMKQGLLEEVLFLLNSGLTYDDISMKGIGYKELLQYLNGEYSLERAITLIKQNTRHLAKHQMTWFKRYENMKWFDLSDENDPLEEMLEWLKKN